MKKEIAELLAAGKNDNAVIRTEAVIHQVPRPPLPPSMTLSACCSCSADALALSSPAPGPEARHSLPGPAAGEQEKMIAAFDIMQLFCELLNVRLQLIEKTKEMPSDMRESISSIIFAASRMPEVKPFPPPPPLLPLRRTASMKRDQPNKEPPSRTVCVCVCVCV